MCIQPIFTDPAQYYVQGWEGYFNTIGAATITNEITLDSNAYMDTFEVTLSATHLKSCLEIRYSNLSIHWHDEDFPISHDFHSNPYLHAYLTVSNTCKSITQVWHA